jgi:hypothetical protein
LKAFEPSAEILSASREGSRRLFVFMAAQISKDLRLSLNLDGAWRVGLPAAARDIWFVPDGFARAVQERGGNLAPQEY